MPQQQTSEASVASLEAIRQIVVKHGNLSVGVDTLQYDSDLYLAGLTSLATVNVMLVLESHFDIEFPDNKLGRATFTTIEAIGEVIAELKG